MKFADLQIKTSIPEEVKHASRVMYGTMKEKDAMRLRSSVLHSLIETMAIQLLDMENKTIPQIDESISAVVEGIVKDNRITSAEGEQMKATAMKAIRRHHRYGDLFLSLATTNVIASVDKKSFTPEIQMSMESYSDHTRHMQESGTKIMETAVFAAAEQVTMEYQKYFPKAFLDLIR